MEKDVIDNWFGIHPLDLGDFDDFSLGFENLIPEEELKKLQEKRREERKRKKEIPALLWLSKEMAIKSPAMLVEALTEIRSGTPYKTYFKKKRSGGKRIIHAPSEQLKKIQRKINRNILKFQLKIPNVFGFSGGDINCAIQPHLQAESMFSVDIKDAFPSIGEYNVFGFFTEGREVLYEGAGRRPGRWTSVKSTYSKLVKFKPGSLVICHGTRQG